MRQFLLLVCVTLCTKTFTQEELSVSLIQDAILHRKDANKIIYLDSSIGFFHSIKSLIRNNTLINFNEGKKVLLKLSKAEAKNVDAQFKKQKRMAWEENLFPNSRMICLDSLKTFDDTAKGPVYFEKSFGRKFFLFNQPVFLRNNTLAFFGLQEMIYPSAGYDFYVFTKNSKESGNKR